MDVATSTPPIGEQAVAAPLPLDTRLGSYRLTRVVGQGGFGIDYEAQDLSLQRRVAIKEYMPSQLATRSDGCTVHPISSRSAKTFELGRRSFVAEARLLAQFRHPGLLEVLHFWEENGTAYMAMPFYEGRTLQQVINKQSSLITQEWLLQTVRPLLDALEHMHAADCYHRDVSADNILILNDGKALLLDFGAARRVIGDSEQALTVMLKPGYAPIEQYADDPAFRQGPWTDIYALSAVLYFAASGKLPTAAASRVMHDAVPPLSALQPPGYDNAFLEAIDKGLSIRPENRPRTIAEFRALLFRDLPVPTGIAQPAAMRARHQAVSPRTAVRRAVATSIGMAVIALAAIGWVVMRPSGEMPPVAVATGVAATGTAAAAAAGGPAPGSTATGGAAAESAATVDAGTVGAGTDNAATSGVTADDAANDSAVTSNVTTSNAATSNAAANSAPSAPSTPLAAAAPASPDTAAPAAASKPANGTLRLAIKPWGEVYVDGVQRGISPPLKQLNLRPGSYRVEIRNPGAPSVTRQIEVGAGKQVAITHRFD
ncbi:MAG: serine/threonine protein kinase [Burkholderiales bacterium]|nr:serine/threonine protein kinase [Burkholderiales bacterium]